MLITSQPICQCNFWKYLTQNIRFMKASPLPSGLAAINTNATIKKTSAKKTHTHEKNRLKETC